MKQHIGEQNEGRHFTIAFVDLNELCTGLHQHANEAMPKLTRTAGYITFSRLGLRELSKHVERERPDVVLVRYNHKLRSRSVCRLAEIREAASSSKVVLVHYGTWPNDAAISGGLYDHIICVETDGIGRAGSYIDATLCSGQPVPN